ncbi:MAG TPA: T9SS type A sorting domain-containing protein [Flavipsychrobacter sp.]|nr:T9SS type A sorting domain-containing protein [Flavipsychrobacter sp.]
MKRILLFAAILVFSKISYAQNFVVSDSSHWYHSMTYGSFHSYVTGDTLIQNRTAKKIRQEALVKQPEFGYGLRVDDLPSLYIHTTTDTTFVFNPVFNRFTPLYVFNVNEGDSVCLPLLHAGGGAFYTGNMGDSMFCFVIDSIRTVTHDTAQLKTYFTRSFTRNNQIELNWGSSLVGAYAQKIGAVYSGLIPLCVSQTNCVSVLSENFQTASAMRCYSDELNEIKLIAGSCNNGGISVAVKDFTTSEISLSPNPSYDKLYVNLKDKTMLQSIDIISAWGQNVLKAKGDITQLNVGDLPPGVYVVRITLRNEQVITQRIIIQH